MATRLTYFPPGLHAALAQALLRDAGVSLDQGGEAITTNCIMPEEVVPEQIDSRHVRRARERNKRRG